MIGLGSDKNKVTYIELPWTATEIKIPSDMEVTPRYTLFILFTLLTMLTLLKQCAYIFMRLKALLDAGSIGFQAKRRVFGWSGWVTPLRLL